jgi:cytochrome o ubiquinol oxidase operon protein cyoD
MTPEEPEFAGEGPAEPNELMNVAPGEPHDSLLSEVASYVVGLALAVLLTAVSFWVASTSTLWGPGVAVGLVVLAIAQMGVHLVFFLHITSGPDNTNNVLALAFGMIIVFLVMIGTIWIMAHLAANMGPPPELTNLHLQH